MPATSVINVAEVFRRSAARQPERVALALADARGRTAEFTFAQLDRWSDGYARGLTAAGLSRGDRVLLLLRPNADFIALALGMLKAGLVVVLVDPGMDRPTLLGCIESASPAGMVGVPPAHVLALLGRRAFSSVRRRWLAGWPSLPGAVEKLRSGTALPFPSVDAGPDGTAAVVFTTGSTGAPKGVVYTHGNYIAQLELLRERFAIEPGEVALPGYLPFAILCLCLGSTSVVPSFHPARPASVEPAPVLELVRRYRPSYGLGSPAFWAGIGTHCHDSGEKLDGFRLLLLFGAEVHESILLKLRGALPDAAEIHTPYGSTEVQPIATISDRELLSDEVRELRATRGICVGRPFDGVDLGVIPVTDEPLDRVDLASMHSDGPVGEVVVRGAMVTLHYFAQPLQDRLHKIDTDAGRWHRMGDCGSFDEQGRLWLAGRKSQRIVTSDGVLFPLPVEARANDHPAVRRSALVGTDPRGSQRPVLVVELRDAAASSEARAKVIAELLAGFAAGESTRAIRDVLTHPGLPVDYRHNAKIQREDLALWAAEQLRSANVQ
jgi:acyl-CoA synthetase (AMP-forming)/AMP-acid ligase II